MPKNRSRWAVIIDGADNDRPLERGQTAVYWSRFDVPGGAVSIPFLVNEDSVALRDEYLPLIHDMGEIRVDGKSVREHLKIGKGFSFWWLTMLAQKSPLKAPSINTVFKLRTFEKYFLSTGFDGLILRSDDALLHQTISRWLRTLGIPYRRRRKRPHRPRLDPRGVFKSLPPVLRALARLPRRWAQRNRFIEPVRNIGEAGPRATVVTYFPNMDEALARRGVFYS